MVRSRDRVTVREIKFVFVFIKWKSIYVPLNLSYIKFVRSYRVKISKIDIFSFKDIAILILISMISPD